MHFVAHEMAEMAELAESLEFAYYSSELKTCFIGNSCF